MKEWREKAESLEREFEASQDRENGWKLQAQEAEAVVRAAEKIWGVIPVTGPGTLGPDVAVPLLAYEELRRALAAYRERA